MDLQHIMEDNTFFYPNCCHVCRRWDIPSMRCGQCRMISYCNKMHQQQHWPQHEEICAAIKLVLEDKEYMNTEEISMEEWTKIRTEYLYKVSVILQRELKLEETQMILFPKACVVCHRQDKLIGCNNCSSAAFCNKHNDESKHREQYCKFFRLSFEINNYLDSIKHIDISYVDRVSNKTFCDMHSFLDTYLPSDKNDIYLRMLQSNVLTAPLTTYFCIQKLDCLKCETLSIHIMGERVLKFREDLQLWKMLLILIPALTILTITFIQAKRVSCECDITTEVLHASETKKLVANIRYMSYAEYVCTADYNKPNFIIGFDAFFIDNSSAKNEYVDVSLNSGMALAIQKCPFILIFQYIERIDNEIWNKFYFFLRFLQINPFMNSAIYRHEIYERPYLSNKYLIIFKKFDSSKVFTDKYNRSVLFLKTTPE